MNRHTRLALEPMYPAPLAYQASVVRDQVERDIKREAEKERTRILLTASLKLEDLSKDYLKLSAAAFIEKYA